MMIFLILIRHYINEVFDDCEKYQPLLGMRNVVIYSIKNEYLNSINFLDTLLEKEIITQFYKNILTNRFNAMNAQYNGDTVSKKKYVQQAFNEVEQFCILNKSKIDSFLNMPYVTAYEVNELNYKLSELQEKYLQYNFVLLQYYYYKAQIEGIDKVKSEIDSLQNAVNGDEKYFEILRITIEEDFMRFIGL
ncbi:MAG: hypothetical protein LBJ63_03110 [Prevotellaceae bacterium]|jgi:hypothetical protein|nr:hypothetical protein [Prevotellaceae bacterium]